MTRLSALNPWPTKLIAASLRNYEQLQLLAGTDVYTIPPKVAAEGKVSLDGNFVSRLNENYKVGMTDLATGTGVEKFWEVDDKVLAFAENLAKRIPATGKELIQRAHEMGAGDMFPFLSDYEYKIISDDGKIPVFNRWEKKIRAGELAPDTLLTLAGLASFTSDQTMLDRRIRGIIG
jgi:transaldolase